MSTENNLLANNFTNSTSNEPNITTAAPIPSPIFTTPSDHYSNRDEFHEFFNTTQLLAMYLTLSPSSPLPSYAPTTTPGIKSGSWDWSPTYTNQTEEQVNFREFIAFISWYAFLILCCFIPTACAYQRRRRNARIIQASLNNMQRRLDELDRMGGLDSLRTQHNMSDMLDLGENRNRDWEFLEALFRQGEEEEGLERRRTMLADMLSGMSVRMLVEREERRRRERGSRLVAALKETSMVRFKFDGVHMIVLICMQCTHASFSCPRRAGSKRMSFDCKRVTR